MRTEREWQTNSAEETIAVGAEIAALLSPPVMLLLSTLPELEISLTLLP